MTPDDRATLERYEKILSHHVGAFGPTLASTDERPGTVGIERGAAFARSLVGGVAVPSIPAFAPGVRVVDALGHERPAYRGLLVHAWAGAVALAGGNDGGGAIDGWCEALAADVRSADLVGPLPAARGAEIGGAAWAAVALETAGAVTRRNDRVGAGGAALRSIVRAQRPGGPFLVPGRADGAEAWWFHELVILHAVATHAVVTDDAAARDAAFRAAAHHQAETQPDHATNDPWALFAFLWNPHTRPLADQVLHAAMASSGGGGGVALLLLADGLYCTRLLLRRNSTP